MADKSAVLGEDEARQRLPWRRPELVELTTIEEVKAGTLAFNEPANPGTGSLS